MSRLPNACPKPRRKVKPAKVAKPRKRIPTISKKRLAKFGGKVPYRSIVQKPRPKSETERTHGPVARREWTKAQPCLVPDCGRTPCDAAHLISGGKGRKADVKWAVPFCSSIPAAGYRGHHDEYDDGKRSFMAKYFPGIERAELACAVEAAWQSHANQRDV